MNVLGSPLRLGRLLTLLACALIFACGACSSQKKTTRKVTVEGPEKKTEIKLETTEKERKDDKP